MNCSYCSKECKNENSLRQHQIRCKDNPNRITHSETWLKAMKEMKGTNQFVKAKELGETITVSSETREKTRISMLGRTIPKHVREKISSSMKTAHSEGRAWNIGKSRWNNQPSWPEQFFMKVIKNDFDNQQVLQEFPVDRYSCDFCWPSLMKVIEIDGAQHERFKEIADRDKRKDQVLKENGYTVLRILWSDMCSNTKETIKIAKQFIDGK